MEILEHRKSYYKMLSRIFLLEMDEDSLAKLEKMENFEILFPAYSKWDERKKRSRYKLINEVLNVDFTDIALMHLIPYESFFTREDGMIESGGANPIIQLYNDFGYRVDLDKGRIVSADHIAVEMEFMSMLIEAQRKARDEDAKEAVEIFKKQQESFLKEHLLNFAPMYLLNVMEQARTPFYKDSAKLALEFMLEDFEYIKGEI